MIIESAILCMTLNLYHEARGEPIEGQLAVALVTLNRADHKLSDVCKVVYKRHQFSWTRKKPLVRNKKLFTQMREIAIRAIHMRDFTGGALFYHSSKVSPNWKKQMQFVGKWGNHLFYKGL